MAEKEELRQNIYLTQQEYEWIIEAIHEMNLDTDEYNPDIYQLVSKLQYELKSFKRCPKCYQMWVKHYSSDSHTCEEEE